MNAYEVAAIVNESLTSQEIHFFNKSQGGPVTVEATAYTISVIEGSEAGEVDWPIDWVNDLIWEIKDEYSFFQSLVS